MSTTVRLGEETKKALDKAKLVESESYESVIVRALAALGKTKREA
jgi:predicted transcriptional regulator